MRWKLRAGGKRGGLRIIYYLYSGETFYMLYAYKKSDQEDHPKPTETLERLDERNFE